jgi:hypothetical protein
MRSIFTLMSILSKPIRLHDPGTVVSLTIREGKGRLDKSVCSACLGLLDFLKIEEVDALLHQERSLRVYEVATPLSDYLRRIASVLPRALDDAFAACDNRAVSSHPPDLYQTEP